MDYYRTNLLFTIQPDEISFELVPHLMDRQSYGRKERDTRKHLPPLDKPILTTSGKLKISQLKKYLIRRLGLENTSVSELEVLCNGEPIGDELSLIFVQKTRCRRDGNIVLTYQYEQDHDQISFLS